MSRSVTSQPVKTDKPAGPTGVGVSIPAPNFKTVEFKIIGTAPLVIHKFSAKAKAQIIATQEAGSTAKTKKKREAKDFDAVYNDARHISTDGWDGIPAVAFKAAMVSACKTVGFMMTRAKLAIFVIGDGIDKDEGTALIKVHGTPHKHTAHARNDNGSIDIRIRPMWDTWHAFVKVRFDADMLTLADISNLLARAGMQVGVCEGRPDSKNGIGCGWGTFEIASEASK